MYILGISDDSSYFPRAVVNQYGEQERYRKNVFTASATIEHSYPQDVTCLLCSRMEEDSDVTCDGNEDHDVTWDGNDHDVTCDGKEDLDVTCDIKQDSDGPCDRKGDYDVTCDGIASAEEGGDGPPSELVSPQVKKRPLSSSSSSSSSTSSLPRHQSKKLASLITSPVTANIVFNTVNMEYTDIANANRQIFVTESVAEVDHVDRTLDNEVTNFVTRDVNRDINPNIRRSMSDQESSENVMIDPSEPNVEDNSSLYVKKVVSEILDTEKTYVRDLREIVHVSELFFLPAYSQM